MNALHKAAVRLLWPSLVVGLATLLAGVALLLLGHALAAVAAGAVCALLALLVLVAAEDGQQSWPAERRGRPTTR